MLNLEETLKSELPQARYLVLELAALLDRLDEAARRERRDLSGDARLGALRQALAVLCGEAAAPNRAERILRLYSEPEPATAGQRL